MRKMKTLYWTPCATHCIDLILEDFEIRYVFIKILFQKVKKNYCFYLFYDVFNFFVISLHKGERLVE